MSSSDGIGYCSLDFRGIYNLAICDLYLPPSPPVGEAIGGDAPEVCSDHSIQNGAGYHNYELHREAACQQGNDL